MYLMALEDDSHINLIIIIVELYNNIIYVRVFYNIGTNVLYLLVILTIFKPFLKTKF